MIYPSSLNPRFLALKMLVNLLYVDIPLEDNELVIKFIAAQTS